MLRFRDACVAHPSRTTVDYSIEVFLRSLPQDESSPLDSVEIVIGFFAPRWSSTGAFLTASKHTPFFKLLPP